MTTAQGPGHHDTLITGDELARMSDHDLTELIDGRIVPLSPTNPEHGRLEANVAGAIRDFVRAQNLGIVMVGEVGTLPGGIPIGFVAPTSSSSRTPITTGERRRVDFSTWCRNSSGRFSRPNGRIPNRRSSSIWRSASVSSLSWTPTRERFRRAGSMRQSCSTANVTQCHATRRFSGSACLLQQSSRCNEAVQGLGLIGFVASAPTTVLHSRTRHRVTSPFMT